MWDFICHNKWHKLLRSFLAPTINGVTCINTCGDRRLSIKRKGNDYSLNPLGNCFSFYSPLLPINTCKHSTLLPFDSLHCLSPFITLISFSRCNQIAPSFCYLISNYCACFYSFPNGNHIQCVACLASLIHLWGYNLGGGDVAPCMHCQAMEWWQLRTSIKPSQHRAIWACHTMKPCTHCQVMQGCKLMNYVKQGPHISCNHANTYKI